MTYKALNTNKTIEINYKRTGYIQERKEKIISEKGNGGETLETKHMLYYFPLSSPLRHPGLGVYPAENNFFLRTFNTPQVVVIEHIIVHNIFLLLRVV